MRLALAACSLLLLAGCKEEDPAKESQRREQKLLSATTQAKRDGGVLTLMPRHGAPVVLTDDPPAGLCEFFEHCTKHYYEGIVADRFFNVEVGYWESDDRLLISMASGKAYVVHGEPRLSPDRRFIATPYVSESESWNGVYMWEIVGDELRNVFTFQPEMYHHYALYEFTGWEGEHTPRFEVLTQSPVSTCQYNYVYMPARLVDDGGAWHLVHDTAKARCFSEKDARNNIAAQ